MIVQIHFFDLFLDKPEHKHPLFEKKREMISIFFEKLVEVEMLAPNSGAYAHSRFLWLFEHFV